MRRKPVNMADDAKLPPLPAHVTELVEQTEVRGLNSFPELAQSFVAACNAHSSNWEQVDRFLANGVALPALEEVMSAAARLHERARFRTQEKKLAAQRARRSTSE